MAAPTPGSVQATAFNTTTTPKATSSFSVSTGDILVFFYCAESLDAATTPTKSAGTATISALTAQRDVNSGSVSRVTCWTATVTAGGTLTIQFARSAGSANWGGQVRAWSGSAGVGVSNQGSYSSVGASSITLTGVSASSAIECFQADWNAGATTGHAWSAGAGSATETLFQQNNGGASYSCYAAYYANAGSAGSKTVGMSAPSQAWSLIGLEVLAGASGDATVTAVPDSGVGDVVNPAASAGSTVTAPPAAGVGDVPMSSGAFSSEIDPPPASGTGAIPAPSVSATGDSSVSAVPGAGLGDVVAPSMSTGAVVSPPPAAGVGGGVAPAAASGVSESPPPAQGAGDQPNPGVSASTAIPAPPLSGTGDLVSPAAHAASSISASPASGSGDVAAPSLSGGGPAAPPDYDTPTTLTVDQHLSVVVLDPHLSAPVLDPHAQVVALDPHVSAVSLDAHTNSLVLDP